MTNPCTLQLLRLLEESLIKAGSISNLAKELGLTRGTINKWLSKEAYPSRVNLLKLREYKKDKIRSTY